ncbi:MAG TPA: response regulator transcription factor [Candidatus Limnocylindria bacterium]|nr:response regulator transcription factor [Candidatus Limnocylindria bacterium]
MTGPIRVLLADDHPVYRDGLRLTLDGWEAATLVGEAADGDAAVQLAARLRPDVILMDLQMPGRSGVEATRAITAADPAVAVVVLTMFEDDAMVVAALRAGARGYLLKGATRDELRRAIVAAASGAAILGPAVADRLTTLLTDAGRAAPPFPDLTDRERQVLELVAQGRANPDIARRLGISEKTVRNHVSLILDKLAVGGRSEAIVRAREAGMGGEPPPP